MQAINMRSNAFNWQISRNAISRRSQQQQQQQQSTKRRTKARATMVALSIVTTTMATKDNDANKQTMNDKNMHRKNRNTRFYVSCEKKLLFVFLALVSLTMTAAAAAAATEGAERQTSRATAATRMQFSLPLTTMTGDLLNDGDDDDNFRPIIPKDVNPEFISRNVFTKSGHYRVFQPLDGESDLRVAVAVKRKDYVSNANDYERSKGKTASHKPAVALRTTTPRPVQLSVNAATASGTPTSREEQADVGEHEHAKDAVMLHNIQGREVKMTDDDGLGKDSDWKEVKLPATVAKQQQKQQTTELNAEVDSMAVHNELKGLEELLIDYVENFFSQGKYEPMPGLVLELQKNHTHIEQHSVDGKDKRKSNGDGSELKRHVRHALADTNVSVNVPRAMESGRLLFGVGVKKLLWPIYMGFQVLKSLLFALFLPTLIGSVSRLIGKGITSGSAGSVPLFVRPMDSPQDLDFRDNNFSFDDDGKFTMNVDDTKDTFNQAASQTQSQFTPYNAAAINQQALDRQHQHMMQDTYLSALQSIGAASFKNSQGISSGSSGALGGGGGMSVKKPPSPANMNTFQTFQKVPATSLLLSNYDPFYSPLLSRLDSVFAQLKLNSENEHCREKLICLMYANPAKYAPYSNLVSAQLSRELNELRKPTSDNPDILRFFKYMRAAKDGQDGVDCEQSFAKCQEFKDFENPAMLSTYNDINKLVQARKFA